tara:strand:+ start:88 stop:306 length:219 start_codon:yes stop_codon:yes gene_type:complete
MEIQMGKNEKTPIIIDDVEYQYEDMSPEQQTMINHIADLDRKLSSARFNVDQLEVGKQAFVNMLTESLKTEE